MASAFSVPGQNASVSYTLPQNVERAVISLSACGQATEEFWYTNAFNSEITTFEIQGDTLYGFSPFREVQLLIDGQLAGCVAFVVTLFLPKSNICVTEHIARIISLLRLASYPEFWPEVVILTPTSS